MSNDQPVRCLRCHRTLRSAASVKVGYGRGCSAKIRQAAREDALAGLTDEQQAKALEIVADGGVVEVREGVFRVGAVRLVLAGRPSRRSLTKAA